MRGNQLWIQSLALWLLCLTMFFGSVSPARAEINQQGGGWLMFLGSGSFEPVAPSLSRLRWWFDGQARFSQQADGLSQTIVRPGLGWALNESTSVWIGYGWIRDYDYFPSGDDRDENRIWQQLLWNGSVSRWSVQSRTRLEQRFVEGGDDVGWRLREFVKVVYPLIKSGRLRFAAYEEIFINLNDTDWGARAGFDQNRVFLGLNVPLDSDRNIQAELGYLNRYAEPPEVGGGFMDHLISFNLLVSY